MKYFRYLWLRVNHSHHLKCPTWYHADIAQRRVLKLIERLFPLIHNLIYKLLVTIVIITVPLQSLRMKVGETNGGVYWKKQQKQGCSLHWNINLSTCSTDTDENLMI